MADLDTIWTGEDAVPDGGPSGTSTNGADTIVGGGGPDTLSAGNGDDTIYGAGGVDTLNGENGNDDLYGGSGNDTLNGGNGDDDLYGGSGNDALNGGNGNDTLIGGKDDDTMTGGNDNDTFVFRFQVTPSTGGAETFTNWFAANGGSVVGGEVANGTTQSQFSVQYTAWLNYLVDTYLKDAFGLTGGDDDIIQVGLNQNDSSADATPYIEGLTSEQLQAIFGGREDFSWTQGKATQTRYYSDEFSLGGGQATIAGEGNDTIQDWGNGSNKLKFVGLSSNSVDANYWDTFLDSHIDGGNTVITYNGGSITLLGVNTTIDALVTGGSVLFE